MNKYIFLLVLAFIIQMPLSTQTIFWEEDFSTGQGWTLESNWSIGGDLLEFNWAPSTQNFDASAISPLLSLPESAGEMTVLQYLDVFSTSSNEMAEISIIHEEGEEVLWSYALSGGNWGSSNGTEIILAIDQYSGQDVQLRFRTFGADTWNWNWWHIFHISMTIYLDNDLAVSEIHGPTQIELMETGTWELVVKNRGLNPIMEYTVKLFNHKTGDLIGSYDETETLDAQASKTYYFDWSSEAAYNTSFYGFVLFEGDEFPGNNTSESQFVRVNPDIDFDIFLWDNDNAIQTITCPVQGDLIEPSKSLTRVLTEAGFGYTLGLSLPANLNDYDIVFATMGCYCLS